MKAKEWKIGGGRGGGRKEGKKQVVQESMGRMRDGKTGQEEEETQRAR